ncbi:Hypothetical protein ADU72_0077 (plasmid) [Pediococcus damnosus]|uniref:Uncharacterized protein n=1 Tax=Pediococcus damnosus TaxID=51663 RepID=A0ABM6A7A4_9LACO|nr:Hypothetical protein ADU72_0077 [Pediococcus damnosus]
MDAAAKFAKNLIKGETWVPYFSSKQLLNNVHINKDRGVQ